MHACEAVIAHFIYGSQICGVEVTNHTKGKGREGNNMHACEAVIAHFIYGSQIYGVEVTNHTKGKGREGK